MLMVFVAYIICIIIFEYSVNKCAALINSCVIKQKEMKGAQMHKFIKINVYDCRIPTKNWYKSIE